jgi:hypothetical protein
MRKPYPSEEQDRFMVRLPEGMRDTLKAIAEANRRTMNAEIVARLEASFQSSAARDKHWTDAVRGLPSATGDVERLQSQIDKLTARVDAIEKK